jgi:hypothetical protein
MYAYVAVDYVNVELIFIKWQLNKLFLNVIYPYREKRREYTCISIM